MVAKELIDTAQVAAAKLLIEAKETAECCEQVSVSPSEQSVPRGCK
jgi:hypothetical protein